MNNDKASPPAPTPWTEADSLREVRKLFTPVFPDQVAAQLRRDQPGVYRNWHRSMLLFAKRTLRFYRFEGALARDPAAIRANMLRNYETSVVDRVYEELGVNGMPPASFFLSLHEKINRRGQAEARRGQAIARFLSGTPSPYVAR